MDTILNSVIQSSTRTVSTAPFTNRIEPGMGRAFIYLFAFAIFFWLSDSADAADEKFPQLRIRGTIYTNVIVTSKTLTDIFILHKGGAANFKLKNLDPELQKQF